jgi:hypothetical protein
VKVHCSVLLFHLLSSTLLELQRSPATFSSNHIPPTATTSRCGSVSLYVFLDCAKSYNTLACACLVVSVTLASNVTVIHYIQYSSC